MNYHNQISEIKNLIANYRIKKAIKELTEVTKKLRLKELEDMVLVQASNYEKIENNRIVGIEESPEERNKVTNNLLAIIDRIGPFLPANGKILKPSNYSTVGNEFDVVIELKNYKKENYYWLSHKAGEWQFPKKSLFLADNLINTNCSEWGSPDGGKFRLCLFEVSPEVHQKLKKWLDVGDFYGIRIDGKLLDETSLKLG